MEAHLVRYGAPTLAGLKSGSLFRLPGDDRQALKRAVVRENRILMPRGFCLTLLRWDGKGGLLLLYCRRMLEDELAGAEAAALLAKLGYPPADLGGCIRELRRRLVSGRNFPHEIGLFLGYPPEDVAGFLADEGGCHCLCSGCWKVYGDVAAARRRFQMYHTCTERCLRLYRQGVPLERMIQQEKQRCK